MSKVFVTFLNDRRSEEFESMKAPKKTTTTKTKTATKPTSGSDPKAPSKGKGKGKGKKGKKGKSRSYRNSFMDMMKSETVPMQAVKFLGSVLVGVAIGVTTQVLLAKTSWSPGAQDGVLAVGGIVLGGIATAFNMPRLGAGVAGATNAIAGGRMIARWMADASTAAVRAQAAALLGGSTAAPSLPAPTTAAAPAAVRAQAAALLGGSTAAPSLPAPTTAAAPAPAPAATAPAGLPAPFAAWSYPTGVPTANAMFSNIPATQQIAWG